MISKKNAKFAKLTIKMVYSKAYQSLNLPARKLLDYVLLQQQWVNTNPSNRKANWELDQKKTLQLKYSTFTKAPFKMHPQSITRGIDQLLATGFIKVQKQGGICKGSISIFNNSDQWEIWEADIIFSTRQPFSCRGFTNHV